MKVRTINLSTTDIREHSLTIVEENSDYYIFELSPDQILVLAQQSLAHIWSYYKLVPRD